MKPGLQQAILTSRIDFTQHLAVFRLRPENPIQFRPGQCATLALEEGGRLIQRPYSIASDPQDPELEFFIELVEGGQLTSRLWDLNVGDSVWIRNRAVGVFRLDEERTLHHMLATVTGVAPFLSILRKERKEPSQRRFTLIHAASVSAELGTYRYELEAMASEGWFTYVPTVSRPAQDQTWRGEVGRVEDLLRKYLDAWGYQDATCYVCGHPEMVKNAKAILQRAGLPKERVKEESYFVLEE